MHLVILPYEWYIGSLKCKLYIMINVYINYSTCHKNILFKAYRTVPMTNSFDLTQIRLWKKIFIHWNLYFVALYTKMILREDSRKPVELK